MTARKERAPDLGAYAALLQSAADCIKLLDREGHIAAVNPGGLRLMGAEHVDDLVGRDWLAFWQGDDRAGAETALADALSGHVGRFDGVAPTLRGEVRHWESLLAPVPGVDGAISFVCAITRDVSALHESARDLSLEQRRSAALIRAVSQIVWRSKAVEKIGGHEDWLHFCGLEDLRGTDFHWFTAVHPDDQAQVSDQVGAHVAQGEAYELSYRLRHRTGTWRWVRDRAVPIRDEAGALVEWVGLIVDVDDQVKREEAFRTGEERLRLAVEVGQIGIWDRDVINGAIRWSSEMKAMAGLPPDAPIDNDLLASQLHPDDRVRMSRFADWTQPWPSDDLQMTFRIMRRSTGEVRWITATGRAIRDEAGRELRRVGTWQDVTDSTQIERKLWHAANHDTLTGLGNRHLFNGVLDAAIRAATDEGAPFTLMLLDVNELKAVNDTLGHANGDLVLKTVAARLKEHCPPGATLARLGGDEFAVLLPGPSAEAAALTQAGRLSAALAQPIASAEHELRCAAELGLVVCPSRSCSPTDALRNADLALYAAKKSRSGRPSLFTACMASALLKKAAGLRSVEGALERRAVVPFYQPKIEIATGRIDGFEALLRWHDGTGWRSPGEISDAFDHPRIAPQLGERMLAGVTEDLRGWREMGIPVGRIAINVSAVEFATTDVAQRVLDGLAAAGLGPSDLDLEITETVVLGARGAAVDAALRTLSEAGLAIALDDFGTGFASLTHLRQYPFDWLKIERAFVSDMAQDADAAAIVSAVIALAHGMRRRVVAEGIETRAQLEALRSIGCDVAQGFLIAKPMPAARVPDFVRSWAGFDGGERAGLAAAS